MAWGFPETTTTFTALPLQPCDCGSICAVPRAGTDARLDYPYYEHCYWYSYNHRIMRLGELAMCSAPEIILRAVRIVLQSSIGDINVRALLVLVASQCNIHSSTASQPASHEFFLRVVIVSKAKYSGPGTLPGVGSPYN